jgi:hypothetical protein
MDHFEIATVAEQSADFRRVLWTGEHTQLVIMTIPPDGEIGEEVHDENDQILSFVSGVGKAVISGRSKPSRRGRRHRAGRQEAQLPQRRTQPAGPLHRLRSAGPRRQVVHKTKEEADQAEAEGKDEPPS